MSKTVADHLWERLGQWHVERIFGYPGVASTASWAPWVG